MKKTKRGPIRRYTGKNQQQPLPPENNASTRTIDDIIRERLSPDRINAALEEKVDEIVQTTIDNMFGHYGNAQQAIKQKLNDMILPTIETHDFGDFQVKLTHLVDTLADNLTRDPMNVVNKLRLQLGIDKKETMSVSDIFNAFGDFVAENVERDTLTVNTEGRDLRYDDVSVSLHTTDQEETYAHTKVLQFKCEEDPSLNVRVTLRKWKKDERATWRVHEVTRRRTASPYLDRDDLIYSRPYRGVGQNAKDEQAYEDANIINMELPSVRLSEMNRFELYVLKLYVDGTNVNVDIDNDSMEVEVKIEPEVHID